MSPSARARARARARQARPVPRPRPLAAPPTTHAQPLPLSAPPLRGPSLPPRRRPEHLALAVAACVHARRRQDGPPRDVTAHSERSACSLPVSPAPTIRRDGRRRRGVWRCFSLPTAVRAPGPAAPLCSARRQRPTHEGCPSLGHSHFLQGNEGGGRRGSCAGADRRPWQREPTGTLGPEGWQQQAVLGDHPYTPHHPIGPVSTEQGRTLTTRHPCNPGTRYICFFTKSYQSAVKGNQVSLFLYQLGKKTMIGKIQSTSHKWKTGGRGEVDAPRLSDGVEMAERTGLACQSAPRRMDCSVLGHVQTGFRPHTAPLQSARVKKIAGLPPVESILGEWSTK